MWRVHLVRLHFFETHVLCILGETLAVLPLLVAPLAVRLGNELGPLNYYAFSRDPHINRAEEILSGAADNNRWYVEPMACYEPSLGIVHEEIPFAVGNTVGGLGERVTSDTR